MEGDAEYPPPPPPPPSTVTAEKTTHRVSVEDDPEYQALKIGCDEFKRCLDVLKEETERLYQNPLKLLIWMMDMEGNSMRPKRLEGPAPDKDYVAVKHALGDKVISPIRENADHARELVKDLEDLSLEDANRFQTSPHGKSVAEFLLLKIPPFMHSIDTQTEFYSDLRGFLDLKQDQLLPDIEAAEKVVEHLKQLPQTDENQN